VTKVKKIVVVGLGEVGRPILELASKNHDVIGVDVSPPAEIVSEVDILHVCFPYGIADFVGEAARYIELFRPALTIINSTVAVGTTRTVARRTGAPVVNSPVRGKHAHMVEDLVRYVKFVGAVDTGEGQRAAEHFRSLGMKTNVLSSPEATELAKLTETTYFGLMIAWAQEVERYCDQLGQNYEDVASFYEEIKFFPPVKYFPGVIGGHCVMPNIKILNQLGPSDVVQAIVSSNRQKSERDIGKDKVRLQKTEATAARPQVTSTAGLSPVR
jgi:UDP-N-acetyl-D-mannosaminuronate dehydrogenase